MLFCRMQLYSWLGLKQAGVEYGRDVMQLVSRVARLEFSREPRPGFLPTKTDRLNGHTLSQLDWITRQSVLNIVYFVRQDEWSTAMQQMLKRWTLFGYSVAVREYCLPWNRLTPLLMSSK